MTEIFAAPDAERQLARFSPTDAAIAALSDEYLPLRIVDVKDVAGYKAVHQARMDVKGKRVAIEKVRKELKADALEYGRKVDAAAKRFVSCEPLLESIDLGRAGGLPIYQEADTVVDRGMSFDEAGSPICTSKRTRPGRGWCKHDGNQQHWLDWVILGGESGHEARPCNIGWIRSIVAQCRAARTAVFVKQLGSNIECIDVIDAADHFPGPVELSDATRPNARVHLRDFKGGDPAEWPEDLRVREYPDD